MTRPVLAALLLAAAAAGGCARGAPPPYTVLGTIPSAGPLAPDDMARPGPGRLVYDIAAGPSQGEQVVYLREAATRFGSTLAQHEGDLRSEFRRLDGEGNLVAPAVIDRGDDAITSFEPPLVVAWSTLEADTPRTQQVQMVVVDLTDPRRQKEAGTATKTLTYGGDYRIRVRGQVYEVHRIDALFKADLKMAEAETTTTLWVVRGSDPVVIERHEVVRTLGIPIRDRRQTLVLVPDTDSGAGGPD
ncbi:MAG: hypothetical protein ACYS0D_02510 [Planctomycetota bacterium]|jgi:hypothetical protein